MLNNPRRRRYDNRGRQRSTRGVTLAVVRTVGLVAVLCAPAWGSGVVDARPSGSQAADASRESQQEQQAPPPAPVAPVAPPPPALPDLRIVSIELSPEIPRDRTRTRIRILVHNDSGTVAAGRIGIQVVHDRRSPQPLPVHHEILYLGADELAEVTFDLFGIDLDSSPYQFFAKVDVFDAVEEANEFNNTIWERVPVCGSPEFSERPDGFDNDCDGMVDEELGLAAGSETALQMLRRLQRQATADSVALVYALPRIAAPFVAETAVRLAPPGELYWGLATEADVRGADVPEVGTRAEISTSLQLDDPGNVLTLVDWNGGDVDSGDVISLRVADDRWIVVGGSRTTTVVPRNDFFESWRLFTVVLIEEEAAEPGRPVLTLALAAGRGRFVELSPDDGVLRVDARRVRSSTTFVMTFVESEAEPGELR